MRRTRRLAESYYRIIRAKGYSDELNVSEDELRRMLGVTVNHQGGPPPLGGGRNWVHFPVYFRSALHTYLSYQIYLLYVLGHLRHPPGKPLDADPVRLCQTLARKGTAEIRFETVFGRSEANVPARQEPLQIVAACRLAWRSGQISDFGTDLLRAAESPSP